MKIDYAIKNISSTTIVYIIDYILKFVQRSIFVYTLPVDYLGLNSLLSDIIVFLSVAEMGIGSAIAYSLYKPLSIGDLSSVKSIMMLLKKIYRIIGFSILCMGIFIIPFFGYLIKDNNIPDIEWFFIIMLFANIVGYFFSYNWVLLTADQKGYIINYYHCVFLIFLNIFQTVFLVIFKSYWSFVLIIFIFKFVENIYISKKIDGLYPFLNEESTNILDTNIKYDIVKNTKALILHKLSWIVSNSSFSVIASKFIGLSVVGLLSNYFLIINAITAFCLQLFKSITAVIGNLLISDEDENKVTTFKFLFFLSAWGVTVVVNCLYIGINDFISLWLGYDFVINKILVLLLTILFYINSMQNTVTLFKESAGLYWQERYRPILEIGLNVFLSIYLVQIYGLIGIISASIVAKILTSFWIEPYVLFSNSLKIKLKEYICIYIKYSFFTFFVVLLNVYIAEYFHIRLTWMTFFIKIGICFVLTNFLWIILFFDKYRTLKTNFTKIKQ